MHKLKFMKFNTISPSNIRVLHDEGTKTTEGIYKLTLRYFVIIYGWQTVYLFLAEFFREKSYPSIKKCILSLKHLNNRIGIDAFYKSF